MRKEAIALGFQLAAEFGIIVDAAIERDGEAKIGIHHGLASLLREVDDGQAPVAERRIAMDNQPGAIRPPRRYRIHHFRLHEGRGLSPIKAHFTTDPTHGSYQSSLALEWPEIILDLIVRDRMDMVKA